MTARRAARVAGGARGASGAAGVAAAPALGVRIALGAAGAAAALALGAPEAVAAEHSVTMPGKVFTPAHLTIVSGDSVVFRNTDFSGSEHDVRGGDGSFATGRLARFGAHRQRFDGVGGRSYVCTIHPGMSGHVEVVAAMLEAPRKPVLAGRPVHLSGRAPAGTPLVAIQRRSGGGWTAAGSAVPAADGSFHVELRPEAPGSYRAVTAQGAGPATMLHVLTGVQVHTGVRRSRRARVVHVHVAPTTPGTVAVLQRYVRERFSWRRKGRVRIAADGTARFRLPARAGGLARVVVAPRGGGAPLATGAPIRLRTGRPGKDPTAGDRPADGPHHDGGGGGPVGGGEHGGH